jgi:NAD-dependent SIR2 family protein deacetylase
MICELSKQGEAAIPTPFHQILHTLHRQGKLLRVYTQNIDALESKAGLTFGVPKLSVKCDLSNRPLGPPKCIPLHGTLKNMHCERCAFSSDLSKYWSFLEQGIRPFCPACDAMEHHRQLLNKRPHAVGKLRPSIVLYNEPHKEVEMIGDAVSKDLEGKARAAETGGADFLLVVGTSLKIPGTKRMVRDFAHVVHSRTAEAAITPLAQTSKDATSSTRTLAPSVAYLNLDFPVPTKTWEGVFDVWVQGDAQTFASMLQDEIKRDIEKRDVVRKKRKREFADGGSKNGKRSTAEVSPVPEVTTKKQKRTEEGGESGGGKRLVAAKKQKRTEEDGEPGDRKRLVAAKKQKRTEEDGEPGDGKRLVAAKKQKRSEEDGKPGIEKRLKATSPSGWSSVPTKKQPDLTLERPISYPKYKQTPGTQTTVHRATNTQRVESSEYSESRALCPALCRLLQPDWEKEGEDTSETWAEIKHYASIMIAQTQQPRRAQTKYEPPSSWGL